MSYKDEQHLFLAQIALWIQVIIVFGVAVMPLLRLLASIGDFRYIVHHMLTVRGN